MIYIFILLRIILSDVNQCPEGQGIDPTNNEKSCIECSGDKYVEDETNICICKDKKGYLRSGECIDCSTIYKWGSKYGIDNSTKKCRICDIKNNEGIDTKTGYCRQCEDNEGIDSDSHEIIVCPDSSKPDPYTHFCQCGNGQGIDPNTKKCKVCDEQLKYAIDIFTGKCRICDRENEIIDKETKKCICTNGKGFNEVTHQCTNCNTAYDFNTGGIDNKTGMCYECQDQEGIDKDTLTCVKCKDEEGINALTGYCEICPEGSTISYNKKCKCEDKKGFNEKNQCTECNVGEGIDLNTYRCISCTGSYGIDPETRKCQMCDPNDGKCVSIFTRECIEMSDGLTSDYRSHQCRCHENFGFDQTTQKCTNCKSQNMAIDLLNQTCVKCPDHLIVDELTNICRCPNKMGFDSRYTKCVECGPRDGINPENGYCENSHYGSQCIDRITGFWIQMDTDTQFIDDDNLCTCKENYGLNYTTRKCEKCAEGQFADPITSKCVECSGDDLGEFNGFCVKCSSINGIPDPKSHKCICKENMHFYQGKCIDCSSNGKWWGADENGKECVYCPGVKGHCIDPSTLICRQMQDNEGIDHEIERCEKCIGGQIKDPNSDKCICKEGLGFDTISKKCIDCTSIPGFALDVASNECIRCAGQDWMINMTTKKCVCADGKGIIYNDRYGDTSFYCTFCSELGMGLNKETGQCVRCDNSKHEAVNKTTGLCEACRDNEGIDEKTQQCQVCENDMAPDQNNRYRCKCPYGLGITKENKCGKCGFGEGIEDNICRKCSHKNGINPITGKCEYCYTNNHKCINRTTYELITTPDGMEDNEDGFCSCLYNFGFDPLKGICVNCKELNQGVNWNNEKCMTCGDDQILDENNRCNCPMDKAFDSEYKHCVKCKDNEGIDQITRVCRSSTYGGECISRKTGMWVDAIYSYQDEKTGLCTCRSNQYYDDINDKCEYCDYGSFYNPIKKQCMTCPPGLALNYKTGECSACPDDQEIDEDAHLCYCKDLKGYDSNYNCIECTEGIEFNTMKCGKIDEYSCLDLTSKLILPMQLSNFLFAGYKDPISGVCKCKGGLGFDLQSNPFCRPCKIDEALNTITGRCEKCLPGQYIDPKTAQCVYCKDGEGFNNDTLTCEKCKEGEGVNPITGKCISCNENEGINPITGECGKCPPGQAIDSSTRMCGICKNGFGVDTAQPFCIECSDKNCVICSSNYKNCISCTNGYTAKDGSCVTNEIEIDAITKAPSNTIKLTYTESIEGITLDIPKDVSDTINYGCEIPESANGKKVIIPEDSKKANIELKIDEKISQVTIQQNENSPLDIVVNYSNIEDSFNPVINIDADPSKANTSLKGEGKLTLENIHGNLQLNQVVPNKDKQIVIQSSSKVSIKQIDFYGNSKVEFKNKQEKAVVNLITIQQKAVTDLDNVAIEGSLKTGLFSLITLNENVDIEKANIEISFSNKAINTNPPIIGYLKSKPIQITIQDRVIGSFLDEDSVLPIAEANNNDFNCNEWANSFVPSSKDAFYNSAKCADDNPKRVVAYHRVPDDKGNGLSGGAIAGIVIGCVAAVAIVVVLVYFFVIRKKKNDSQNEDSMSSA